MPLPDALRTGVGQREDTDPLITEVVGGYRLDALIGEGGMGRVFRATHLRLGRRAAVKILSSRLAEDAAYVSRFFHEARIVNEIKHPNLVDVFDFIETDAPRRVAYIMELIEGPSLARVVRQRPLSLLQATHVMRQLASALSAVHTLRVIHRDLKPDNILLTGALDMTPEAIPSIKVLDFGIAKIPEDQASHKTNTGVLIGTPVYMAPEQIASGSVSPATDVYALGEIFYEILTGHRLFSGDNAEVLKSKLLGTLPSLEFPRNLPLAAKVEGIVRGCLAQRATDRPTTAELDAILTALAHELTSDSTLAITRPRDRQRPSSEPSKPEEPAGRGGEVPSSPRRTELAPTTTSELHAPSLTMASSRLAPVWIVALLALLGLGGVLGLVTWALAPKEAAVSEAASPRSDVAPAPLEAKAVPAIQPASGDPAKPGKGPVAEEAVTTGTPAATRAEEETSTPKLLPRSRGPRRRAAGSEDDEAPLRRTDVTSW